MTSDNDIRLMTSRLDIKSRLKRSVEQTRRRTVGQDSQREKSRPSRPARPSRPSRPSRLRAVAPSERALKLQAAVGGEIVANNSGEYLLIRGAHGAGYRHGKAELKKALNTRYCLSHAIKGADTKTLDARHLLFYDTETTGLSGVGAMAFLAGVGSFTAGGFETRQYLIPDFSDEAAMLEALLAEFGERTVIVSYNGRAFDLPLTTDRMILNRVARKVPHAHHLDLLYTARALFKRRIGSCSLGNVEAEIFDYRREHDIPGYLVPGVYFDWVREEKTADLGDVLNHNRQDIVSLALLLATFSEIHDSQGGSLVEPLDVYSYMRRLESSGQRHKASALGHARRQELDRIGSAEIEFQRSLIFKRAGDFSAALSLWENLESNSGQIAQLARLELAKWHEHKGKDLIRALALADRGLSHCPGRSSERVSWRRRQARLKRRLRKQ